MRKSNAIMANQKQLRNHNNVNENGHEKSQIMLKISNCINTQFT